jgi:hypothetical protein
VAALLWASDASAQETSRLLPRADFTFEWAGLVARDRRFDWQGRVTFDLDVADYGFGRARFRGSYEAVLGRERRRYDLNQGTYFFEASGSRRLVKDVELVGFLSHVSRHLVDRENAPAVSWNTVGARAEWRPTGFDTAIQIARVTQPAFVDYAWTADARILTTRRLSTRVSASARAEGGIAGVHREVAGRLKRRCGGLLEGSLAFDGVKADLEAFVSYERRLNGFPTERHAVRMWAVGFRFRTR